ncbi:MAG TPA: hypothetical protein DCG71_05080 [Brevundimonas sp.]|nr:hypothetical protein [Brevundimonas sp.]
MRFQTIQTNWTLFFPSPPVGEGGRRRRSDEGCRRKFRCSAPQPCDHRMRRRSHPSSVRLRLPPSPTRGEGSRMHCLP